MKITRISPISGNTNEREIDVTLEQLDHWRSGELIQNAMPHLSPDDREFIMTGITPEEWDAMFNREEGLEKARNDAYNDNFGAPV